MNTRKDYLDGKCDHAAYYGEIVRDAHVRVSDDLAREARIALDDGDTHLNTIPLKRWDIMAAHVPQSVAAALRARGDFPTLAGMVCVLKAAAKMQADALKG